MSKYKWGGEDAERRLEATKRVQALLDAATAEMVDAGVHNAKIYNALDLCKVELASFRRATKYAISKRREREKSARRRHDADDSAARETRA